MQTVKLVYSDGREELCKFAQLPGIGQATVIDGRTRQPDTGCLPQPLSALNKHRFRPHELPLSR